MLVYSDAGPDSPAEEATIKQMDRGGRRRCCASPGRTSPSRATICCRCGCAAAAARSAARCPGRSRRSWRRSPPESPFAGLAIPADVTVARQVLAEPDLDLANKTWARLADGTPLVTAEKRGKGWIVLVHTTANAEWSNLALSGLFVEMLRRVVAMSQGVAAAERGRAAAARDARRVRPAAARAADRPADRRQGDRHRDAVAAPSARLLRHRRRQAGAQPVGRGSAS